MGFWNYGRRAHIKKQKHIFLLSALPARVVCNHPRHPIQATSWMGWVFKIQQWPVCVFFFLDYFSGYPYFFSRFCGNLKSRNPRIRSYWTVDECRTSSGEFSRRTCRKNATKKYSEKRVNSPPSNNQSHWSPVTLSVFLLLSNIHIKVKTNQLLSSERNGEQAIAAGAAGPNITLWLSPQSYQDLNNCPSLFWHLPQDLGP